MKSNAGHEPLPEAGATLEAVGYARLLPQCLQGSLHTPHVPDARKGCDNLYANLDRDPLVGEQQCFAWFVPVEDDIMPRMPDLSVLENIPDL